MKIKIIYDKIELHYYKRTDIVPTSTLISKIILGITGLMPAYDRYVKKGISEYRKQNNTLLTAGYHEIFSSLKKLFTFYLENKDEFLKFNIREDNRIYPPMKKLDIFFWQFGFDFEEDRKKNKTTQN